MININIVTKYYLILKAIVESHTMPNKIGISSCEFHLGRLRTTRQKFQTVTNVPPVCMTVDACRQSKKQEADARGDRFDNWCIHCPKDNERAMKVIDKCIAETEAQLKDIQNTSNYDDGRNGEIQLRRLYANHESQWDHTIKQFYWCYHT